MTTPLLTRPPLVPISRRELTHALLIALALFTAYFALAAGTDLWDRDEPRYARAAVEMWNTGDYLIPWLNDEPRLRKPPMIYWMMAPFVGLLGPTALAARLVCVICMTAAALLTWLAGRRLFSPNIGLGSMAIFGTATLTLYVGSASIIDAPLVMFTTLAIYCFIDAIYRKPTWWHWPTIALSLASVVLLKGPLVWPIPVATIAVAGFLARKQITLPRSWWIGFATLALLSFVPLIAWALPVDRATDGQLYAIGFQKHVLDRVTTGLEGHGSSNALEYFLLLPLYIPILLLIFFPWTLHLPAALSAMIGRRLGNPLERAVLWAWTLPWFILASLASTKLPHYILPILPALAIAVAATIARHHAGQLSDSDRRWMTRGIFLALPVALGGAIAAIALPWALDSTGLILNELPVVIALLAITFLATYHHLKGRVLQSARLIAAATPPIVIAMVLLVLPTIENQLKASPAIAAAIHQQQTDPTAPLYMRDYDEPTLFFYVNRPTGHPIVQLNGQQVANWARGEADFTRQSPNEAGLLIIGSEELDRIQERFGELPLETTFSKNIIDYSSGTQYTQVMLVKPTTPNP
ncbi:MAG: glycosyltransferase family 39 protein [Phycisphaeraceae bacterium]